MKMNGMARRKKTLAKAMRRHQAPGRAGLDQPAHKHAFTAVVLLVETYFAMSIYGDSTLIRHGRRNDQYGFGPGIGRHEQRPAGMCDDAVGVMRVMRDGKARSP